MAKKSIKIFSVDDDKVVRALVASGRTTYEYALDNLFPLIDRLDIQRRIQNPRFYDRLKRDILKGCVMPPITLAFVEKNLNSVRQITKFSDYVSKNISNGFILDGIQRLQTLRRALNDDPDNFPNQQPLFLNIILCNSTDNLLYRMITLNNGQKPMTTRHQIEILTSNLYDFDESKLSLFTEKSGEKKKIGFFNQADFVLGYMAFLSNSTSIDSQKLIQEKLDELIASKILEHDPSDGSIEFSDVLELIAKLCKDREIERWFKVSNNLIGFCASVKSSYDFIKKLSTKKFKEHIDTFEHSLSAFDISKIRLGKIRRTSVSYFIKHLEILSQYDANEITEKLLELAE